MKSNTNLGIVIIFLVMISVVACSQKKFKESPSGFKYMFHEKSKDTVMAREYSTVSFNYAFGTKDSILDKSPQPIQYMLSKSQYKGDLNEALAMVHKGDSVSFIFQADSFFMKTLRSPQVPPLFDSVKDLYFHLKVVDIKPESPEQNKQRVERENAEKNEPALIQSYLSANNITVQPTASGLYYIETKPGTGANPAAGKTVKVHYTGTLLDGTKFDSSLDRGEPFEFILGQGQVIKGWDEGIALMKKGGKAKLIIPSSIGYGNRAAGPTIKPFSTLVFEVELLDIK